MRGTTSSPLRVAVIEGRDLQQLIDYLWSKGFKVIGPTLRYGAVLYDSLGSTDDLPIGLGDEQERGSYRITKRSDAAFFGYSLGPTSLRRFFNPPDTLLWRAKRSDSSDFGFLPAEAHDNSRFALFGVRSCELHALAILERVLAGGEFVDAGFQSVGEGTFTVAVNCAYPSATCFCTSMQTGPRATLGSDMVLTEALDGGSHRFIVEVTTESGLDALQVLPYRAATAEEKGLPERISQQAAQQMRRSLQREGLKELLYRSIEHPHWEEIGSRCLTCGNCTMVCPTCFCSTVEDRTDLAGEHAERRQRWDSCFSMDFTYIHGGVVRSSPGARYRQWMMHKLATWIDQFGTPGCVGCGRCITWCPAAIDITEEARVLRKRDVTDETTL